MPRKDRPQPREDASPEDWPESRRELIGTVEELDKACARARQLIYRLRPLLRDAKEAGGENEDEGRPVRGRSQADR